MTQRLSENFTLKELTRSSTAIHFGIDNIPNKDQKDNLKFLCLNILEPVRKHFNVPFTPSSGFRSHALNKIIGGSKNSQHCYGEAVDFGLPGVGNYKLACWIRDNLAFDQLILENYNPSDPDSGWIHVSLKRNRKEVLTYSKGRYHEGLIDEL